MKKGYITIFFFLLMFLLLTGCSGKTAEENREPDTDTQTQVHMLGSDQKVVYKFHLEQQGIRDFRLKLNLLDENTGNGEEAQNWLVAYIGSASGPLSTTTYSFFDEKNIGKDAEGWDLSNDNTFWRLLSPGSFEFTDDTDMELAISRKGEVISATLDIDGARAWEAYQTIKNLGEEACYFYLSLEKIALSNITYSEIGTAMWTPTGLVRVALQIGFIILSYLIHRFAKKIEEDHVFLTDGGLPLATGAWVLSLLLFVSLILVHEGIPISRNFYYLPFALPNEGTAFWIMTVIVGLIALGLMIFFIVLANYDVENPLKYLFCSILLGACHVLWFAAAVFLFLELIGSIIQLIGFVVLLVLVVAFFKTADNMEFKHVLKTTRVYNKDTGETLYEKTDFDIVLVDKDEGKK